MTSAGEKLKLVQLWKGSCVRMIVMHVHTSAFKPLSITTGSSMMPSRSVLVGKTGPLTTPSRDGGLCSGIHVRCSTWPNGL
ncbi:hypothetical protein FA95DRAFT_1101500 [Auriscalpium vulgare]|uniref:Uncharacterized protein n=1 Tax=Auriscalpium vulgare TaxID=40419 RepID=A0ACB8RWW7_9AGAM|nr:hypothetical protein FA95DRAFT_1101500 [Auriscalpium vulgare]